MNTLLIIIEQVCLYIPLVCGAYISMSLLKLPDLSIETAYVFGAILGSQTIAHFVHTPHVITLMLALLASLIGGMLVGLCSTQISRIARIPQLLACIITFGIFHGINQLVLGKAYFSLNKYGNPLELLSHIPRHPELIMLLVISLICACCMILFFRTQLSYACAFFGNNPLFFTHYGTSTSFIVMMGVMLANGLAGISGYLFAQSNGFVEISIGYGKVLLCITAIILGKVSLGKNRPLSLIAPLFGLTLYFVLQQTLLKVGFNLKFFTAVQSLLVLIFITIMYRAQGQHMRGDQLGV